MSTGRWNANSSTRRRVPAADLCVARTRLAQALVHVDPHAARRTFAAAATAAEGAPREALPTLLPAILIGKGDLHRAAGRPLHAVVAYGTASGWLTHVREEAPEAQPARRLLAQRLASTLPQFTTVPPPQPDDSP